MPHTYALKRLRNLVLIACSILCLPAVFGCPSRSATDSGPSSPGHEQAEVPAIDPAELIENVRSAYASATAYRDNGRLSWEELVVDDQWRTSGSEFSLAFERPNRLRMRIIGLSVACDGEQLRAVIEDDATNNYDRQMLQRKAPPEFTLGDLFSDLEMSKILRGELFADAKLPFELTTPPLRLLVGDDALDGEIRLLADAELDGKTFHRVQIQRAEQTTTLWVDRQTHLIRRWEFPEPDAGLGVRRFVADFDQAQFLDAQVLEEQTFALKTPPAAKRVSYFVQPPLYSLPNPLFGTRVDDFVFETADDTVLTADDLQDKIPVFCWFMDNPESAVTLQDLQKVAKDHADEDRIRFFAVSPQPDVLTTASIVKTLESMGVDLPLLRDTRKVGQRVFRVTGAPTVVVLDGQGKMQVFKAGVSHELEQMLTADIEHLLAGEDVAGPIREFVADAHTNYRQQLAGAQSGNSPTVLEVPDVPLAPASEPARLKLNKLWECREVGRPGNLLVVSAGDGQTSIFVFDQKENWHTLAELNAQGERVRQLNLPNSSTAPIALLRTAVDRQGRRWYAGGARRGSTVCVFDENWKHAFSYPPDDARHDGVGDFALIDFGPVGGMQLCVGFWGLTGVHGVDMRGQTLWRNRAATPVFSLAPSPPGERSSPRLLATTNRGQIVAFDGSGKNTPPAEVRGFAITQLVAANTEAGKLSPLVGISIKPDGSPVALMLDEQLNPPGWEMPLPNGPHQNQIDWIASGRLLPGEVGQWVFAGADSTIVIVSSDGSFADSFAVGKELTGIAVTAFGSKRVLLAATPDSITAWQVELPD